MVSRERIFTKVSGQTLCESHPCHLESELMGWGGLGFPLHGGKILWQQSFLQISQKKSGAAITFLILDSLQ